MKTRTARKIFFEDEIKILEFREEMKPHHIPELLDNVINKLYEIAEHHDSAPLDRAIDTYRKITKFNYMVSSRFFGETFHRINGDYVSTNSLFDTGYKALGAFLENPADETILPRIKKAADEVSKTASEAHKRESFFGKHFNTRCDIEEAIEKVVGPRVK